MALASLQPARTKLDWAKRYIDTLNKKIRELEAEYESGMRIESQEDRGRDVLVIPPQRPIPDAWILRLGDALHNLRASLDYVIYQAAILESRQDPPPYADKLMFPILLKRKQWPTGRLRGLSGNVVDIVHDFQPFTRGGKKHPLYILNRLDAIDKHRRLHVTTNLVEVLVTYRFPNGSIETQKQTVNLTGSFEYKTEIPGLSMFEMMHPEGDYEIEAPFYVVFDEGSPIAGHGVTNVLEALYRVVDHVISAFENVFPGQMRLL